MVITNIEMKISSYSPHPQRIQLISNHLAQKIFNKTLPLIQIINKIFIKIYYVGRNLNIFRGQLLGVAEKIWGRNDKSCDTLLGLHLASDVSPREAISQKQGDKCLPPCNCE